MSFVSPALNRPWPVSRSAPTGIVLALVACLSHTAPSQAQTAATGATSATGGITPSDVSAPSTRVVDGFSSFFQADASYSSWRGSRGSNVFDPTPGKGSQFYLPAIYGFDYQQPDIYRLQVRVKGGYVHSNHGTRGQEASIDTAVDTQVTAAWTYLGNENYRTFAGIALNLPTGTTVLKGDQRLTRMDPDLVEVGSYGAGFNVNPTAGFIFALTENTAVSMGAGYAWQGAFNREGLDSTVSETPDPPTCTPPCPNPTFNSTRRIDPGDVFTANVNTSSIFNNLGVKTSFAFMSETSLKQDGVNVGRKGAQYTGNIAATYRIDPRWSFLANLSASYTEKNKIRDDVSGVIFTERKNSNSPVLIGSFGPTYALSPNTILGANYSFLWRRHNYYDFTDDLFIPAKTKHSAGGSISYMPTPGSLISLRASYFWVHVDDGAFVLLAECPITPCNDRAFTPPRMSFEGWTTAISGRIQF